MGNLSAEEEIASHLIRRLDEEVTVQLLRELPERLRDLSAKHTSFMQTQRWDEIVNLQSENGRIVESGISMVGEKLRTQGLAWANYTRNIHGEAGGLQQSITRCVQETERISMPRRSKGKGTVLNHLLSGVDEFHKRIRDITDTTRAVAEKAIDASGSLTRSGGNPSLVNTDAGHGPDAWELKSHNMEGVPWVGTEPSEHLTYWESRVRELDDCCIDLRNNLLSSSKVLDEQQATIDNLQRRSAAPATSRTDRGSSDRETNTVFVGPLVTVFFVFLALLMTQVKG